MALPYYFPTISSPKADKVLLFFNVKLPADVKLTKPTSSMKYSFIVTKIYCANNMLSFGPTINSQDSSTLFSCEWGAARASRVVDSPQTGGTAGGGEGRGEERSEVIPTSTLDWGRGFRLLQEPQRWPGVWGWKGDIKDFTVWVEI